MKVITIFIVLLLASLLRFWQLGNVPPSPDWDEAALGYNAYSIMQTGRDEYGKFLPIILRSFDDYKPALYTYLAIPSIKIFGLNVFAVRFPSAVFGILTVLATYILMKEVLKDQFLLRLRQWKLGVPEISAFLLAISPWHIQFSRVAFESNVGVAFNLFAVLFFIKGLKRPFFLIISAIFAASNFYMYQNEKVFTPLIALSLLIIFRKEVFAKSKKYLILAFFTGAIVTLPLFFTIATSEQSLMRAKGVSVFSDQTPFLSRTVGRIDRDTGKKDLLGLVLDNRRITYGLAFISGYLSHVDLNWLFIKGDEARHHAPYVGLLYIFELPFLLIGLYGLIFSQINKKVKYVLLLWLLIAPIPASITTGVPHAVRTLNLLPTLQIFTAIGILTVIGKMMEVKQRILNVNLGFLFTTLLLLFVSFNAFYYIDQYFVQQNYFNSQAWQYGYEKAILEVRQIENRYDKIVVTNKPYLDQSYMFFLFYLQYPPAVYQKEAEYASGGFAENHKFGKYEFRPIDWNKEDKTSKILYVGRPTDFPEGAHILKTINFLDGKPTIKIVQGS